MVVLQLISNLYRSLNFNFRNHLIKVYGFHYVMKKTSSNSDDKTSMRTLHNIAQIEDCFLYEV